VSETFIVDASVGFAWVYPAQASSETDRLLELVESGAVIVVPSLWFLEVANGLLAAQRRKLLTAAERKKAFERLSDLTFSVDEEAGRAALKKTSDLAEKHGLSVYDAAYLETALRRKLPLGSRDEPLRKAAKRCGVTVLG
jgi:predicted nucleic acid-binding protein